MNWLKTLISLMILLATQSNLRIATLGSLSKRQRNEVVKTVASGARLPSSLTSSRPLGKRFNLSVPQFPQL